MLLSLLLACDVPVEAEEVLLSETRSTTACQLSSPSTELDFGAVEVSETPATLSVEFENTGEGTCLLQGLSFTQSGAAFEVAEFSEPQLDPGQSLSVQITYSPPHRGVDQATLVILSNDAENPDRRLAVQGQGLAQELSLFIHPQPLQETAVGCEDTQSLTLANTGEKDLVIEGVTLGGESESFQWSEDALALAFPLTLQPGQAQSMDFVFQPLVDGLLGGHLQVQSDDPFGPVHIEPLTGRGVVIEQVADRFIQEVRPKTDVVFAFDWSGPIGFFWSFAPEVQWMTDVLDEANVDYHIIAVVGDEGCPVGGQGPVDSTQSWREQTERFSEQVCIDGTQVCPYIGANQERAFMMLGAALDSENTGPGGCNEGVFRDDAELHLISLSDEPEQSSETPETYMARFQNLKDDPADLTFHGIGGEMPNGCGNAAAYDRYYDAVVATGGAFRSICDTDYVGHMVALGAAVVPERHQFQLSRRPVLETLRVEVDGAWQEAGWAYDAENNRVVFEENQEPGRGSEFAFHYAEQEDCHG